MSIEQAHAVFSQNDCCGRLDNTKIVKVGDAKVGKRIYSVFDLDFINPKSRHGMQRIAIIEGDQFRGSYTTEGAKIVIDGNIISLSCDAAESLHYRQSCNSEWFEPIDLSSNTLPAKILISGYLVDLEQTI
ncbi:hypothetical protein [Altererythrobacter sp. ZODW24]|uniref:hypothetical protein n=1 Tax=Altererythrobacter sp. ZODW24 TaxID=2185142 RepID=UPI0013B45DE5|nr:hypothetical protein [Altererythrobacter sp. ZODW24]